MKYLSRFIQLELEVRGDYPIALTDSQVVVSYNNKIIQYNRLGKKITSITLPISNFIGVLLSRSDLFRRFFRFGVIGSCCYGDEFICWTRKKYFIINMSNFEIIGQGAFPDNVYPLYMTYISSEEYIPGFYFGGYLSNPQKKPVSVYRVDNFGCRSIFTFDKGEINHIHNILYSEVMNKVFLLCGDFGDGARIVEVSDSWKQHRALLKGQQHARTCIGLFKDNCIVYPTDTSSEENGLVKLDLETGSVDIIASLPASSIYGDSNEKQLYFSTNLEASLESKSRFSKWVSTELPKCFKTKFVHLYMYRGEKLLELVREKSDGLPLRLFQYPTFFLKSSCGDDMAIGYRALKGKKRVVSIYSIDTSCVT